MSNGDSSDTSTMEDETWVSWFCSLSGNEYFCEVDKAFIADNFNLYGLKQYIGDDYNRALDMILDRIDNDDNDHDDSIVSQYAALLYGMIHARYIITAAGLEAMHQKYIQKDFGECPRMHCRGQATLPMGTHDEPRVCTVKLFCPRCQDVYNCDALSRQVDGAYFGSTFPHLFFMSYENEVPETASESYVPRVFGFKIHKSSKSLPQQKVAVHDASRLKHGMSRENHKDFDSFDDDDNRSKGSKLGILGTSKVQGNSAAASDATGKRKRMPDA